jgi:hypothetical protein
VQKNNNKKETESLLPAHPHRKKNTPLCARSDPPPLPHVRSKSRMFRVHLPTCVHTSTHTHTNTEAKKKKKKKETRARKTHAKVVFVFLVGGNPPAPV